ncbi:MAG: polysaccharide deacetylase family protein [Chitinophagales bacterium]|nr:polysaccharide deacetylase family protein [Chitinophagales bacterium]MDW8273377.1 polysaccharide deacetylase family protein [Chitinophagales bacterium]
MSVKEFIKSKTLGLFVKTGGLISRQLYGGKGFIICLHRVLPRSAHHPFWKESGMAVSPEYLEWLITSIRKKGFDIVSLQDVVDILRNNTKRPFAAITLDDGWRDNLIYGYEVFKKHNCPFAIFVSNCFPNHTALDWADALTDILCENNLIEFEYESQFFSYKVTSRDDVVKCYQLIRYFILDSQSLEVMKNKINAVFKTKKKPLICDALTWNEINQLAKEKLCTIGAHTMNHVPLAKFSLEEAACEIEESKRELEEKTGNNINFFAYPFGTKNECSLREFDMAEKAGFLMSVTGRQGNVSADHKRHLQAVPRFPIGETTGNERLNYITNGILHFSFNGFKKTITD